MRTKGKAGILAAGLIALTVSACGDLLTVSDPQRYTSEDLDKALEAVANGVEGAFHEVVDNFVIYQALLGDEYQHTGTWSGYDEVDHGRFQYGTSPMDGTHNSWLRARWFAGDAEERLNRVLGEGEAGSEPMMAQVHMSEGLTDLYIGMTFCESPAVPSGPAVADAQILEQARTKLTRAISTAQSAGTDNYRLAALAGRATASLLLGQYSEAASDAAQIPAGFSYDAIFNVQSTNSIVTLTTKNYNEAGGLMYKWWPRIEQSDDPGYMADPWTGQPDRRLPVYFDGEVATDNETPHYSQWKYNEETDDIPLLHSEGMRLIEAEALVMSDKFGDAMVILNDLRAAAGLDPLDTPTDRDTMMEILIHERFAEHFMEGIRAIDMYRFGLTNQIFGELEAMAERESELAHEIGQRPSAGRPTKFSMTDTEPTYNDQIDDDLLQRCLPVSN